MYYKEKKMTKESGCKHSSTARRGPVAEDLTGQKFGALTVLSRAGNRGGRTCWACRCVCGNIHNATAHALKAGKVKSCGCLAHQYARNAVDLTGRRFGRLLVIEKTDQRNASGSIIWRCKCDCGQGICLSENALMHGNYRSCGCLKREKQKELYRQLHFVDGTCLEIIEKRKYRRDNASGFRGVFQMKNGRYLVNIGFKGKRYYIGTYKEYDDAVAARLEAEHLIHDGFLRDYHLWQKKADADPAWAKGNPFVFDVKKKSGIIEITSNMRNV